MRQKKIRISKKLLSEAVRSANKNQGWFVKIYVHDTQADNDIITVTFSGLLNNAFITNSKTVADIEKTNDNLIIKYVKDWLIERCDDEFPNHKVIFF